jgi:hypothetical protein
VTDSRLEALGFALQSDIHAAVSGMRHMISELVRS